MVQLTPLHPKTPSPLASFKSRLVSPFRYRLTRVVLEKRPLNRCSSSSNGGQLCHLSLQSIIILIVHTHTHPFNGPFSWTTRVSQYQKGQTNLNFTEARDSEWQWRQLDHMQTICTTSNANKRDSLAINEHRIS